MDIKIDATCSICHRIFCCGDCRWNHEQAIHGLQYDCNLCTYKNFLFKKQHIENIHFMQHLTTHLPLKCDLCGIIYNEINELMNTQACDHVKSFAMEDKENFDTDCGTTDKTCINQEEPNCDESDKCYADDYKNDYNNNTPMSERTIYDGSDNSYGGELLFAKGKETPHPKIWSNKGDTYVKRKFPLVHGNFDSSEDTLELARSVVNNCNNDTPELLKNDEKTSIHKRAAFALAKFRKIQSVTTSTPRTPYYGSSYIFTDYGADSRLSDLGSTNNDLECPVLESPKLEETPENCKRPKSIIANFSSFKLASQDSTDNPSMCSSTEEVSKTKQKRVKFADDTIFKREVYKREFRKPRRKLTPGPQKPHRSFQNPSFMALLKRFEQNQTQSVSATQTLTPVTSTQDRNELKVAENVAARAIDFEECGVSTEDTINDTNNATSQAFNVSYEMNEDRMSAAIGTISNKVTTALKSCAKGVMKTGYGRVTLTFEFQIQKSKESSDIEKSSLDDRNDEETEYDADCEHNTLKSDKDETTFMSLSSGTCIGHVETDFGGSNVTLIKTGDSAKVMCHNNDGTISTIKHERNTVTTFTSRDPKTPASVSKKRKYTETMDTEHERIDNYRRRRIQGRPPIRRDKRI